jgi:hypothetical protein
VPRPTREDSYQPFDRSLLVSGPLNAASTRKAFEQVVQSLLPISEVDFTPARIKIALATVCENLGLEPRDLRKPLFVALTGRAGSGDAARLAARLGKQAAIERVRWAIVELSTVA